uniref:Clathrin adaptor alpha/beta/gamma-adaptin appendage Ig-like subdomain domain-containing protein n=1 Tax=Alexandrium monilatum TaxID=311494 RepID=A0A7S4R4C1_9DINO|mmetsp:Transcript_21421/g.67512  ORF Transcript_21421/g.67512 Transcript_21421/m.67512 type:complete len:647 (-) Transcript_21421:104-2044(-)
MSSIDVVFEVLPEEGPGDRSASEVCEELQRQLSDPRSTLRTGDFGRYAAQATLSGPGQPGGPTAPDLAWGGPPRGAVGPPEQVTPPPPPPMSRGPAVETVFGGSGGGAAAGGAGPCGVPSPTGVWGPRGPYDLPAESQSGYGGGDWQGPGGAQALSNAELVDKISRYEQQLVRTAASGQEQPPPVSRTRLASAEVEVRALQDKCLHYEHRLEAVERELREAQEALRSYKSKSEQLELKLKDREQLLVHAKEMWMKENVRASKLADSLTSAEDKLADQEKRLSEVADRYDEAQREVRQLQHLMGGGGDAPAGGAGFSAIPAADPNPAMGRPPLSLVDASFSGDMLRGDQPRGTSAGRLDSADLAGGAALPPPIESDTNADRFRRLCILNDAVLYEDELLQIGVKAEYNGREGQFAVFFGNKGSAALQAFTVQYFVREEQLLKLSASPLNQQLDADKQVVQRVSATCVEPFVQPVWLRVQFLLPDTSPRRIQVRFPLVVTKFMVGCELSPAEFFRNWRQQNFVLNEVTAIVHLAARLRGQLVYVARSIVFGGALRLHHGVDTNPDNFVLVARLADAPGDSSKGADALGPDPDRGLSLVRVEVGTGRFTGKARVVVRSSNHVLARALCDCILLQLAEPNTPQSSDATAR